MDAKPKEGKIFVDVEIFHGRILPGGKYYTINKRSTFSEFDEEIKRIALLADETLIYNIDKGDRWSIVEMSDYHEKLIDGEHVLVESKTLTKQWNESCCIL